MTEAEIFMGSLSEAEAAKAFGRVLMCELARIISVRAGFSSAEAGMGAAVRALQ